jgi:outer membrane protein assembly factor BamB
VWLAIPVLPLVIVTAGAAAEWPCWRGPNGQGISTETGFATEWSAEKNIAWKSAVPGRGHSSPVVWGNRIFLTTAVEGAILPGAAAVRHVLDGQDFVHPESLGADRSHRLEVLCFDLESGKLVWEKPVYEGAVYDARHRKASFASPTSAVDGDRVFSYFGAEGVYCHDHEGRLLWQATVGKIATLGMGVGSSPLLHGELLVLQCDEDNGAQSFIAALDRSTGKEVWRRPRQVQVTWSTPVVVTAGGRAELVATGPEWIHGYEPATGKELWRVAGLHSNAIHTPLAGHGLVYASAGYPKKRVIALRPGPLEAGAAEDARVAWQYERGTGYVVSPILHRDLVYLVSDQGLMTSLEATSGKVVYEGARLPKAARFTASPVAFEDRLLLVSEEGDAFLVRAGPQHEVLGTCSLGERVYASPALARGRILLRTESSLVCVRRA